MKKLIAIALLLGGCASSTTSGPLFDLQQATVKDLTAAAARAKAANDVAGAQCYNGLIPIVQSASAQAQIAPPAGVVDAFEAARLLAKKAQTVTGANDPVLQGVNLACAPLFNDAQGDILRLGVKFRP